MVARINTSKNISRALNYNEQKVAQGKAEIIQAAGFIKDAAKLNFYDKRSQFERHISLNERTKTNALHISLNFDSSEQLSNEKLALIAEAYMTRIGFAHQPYLVYRHYDAGHPHIHIVSTNIERDGKRISLHRLGANQSEQARKAIEIEFNLVKAEGRGSDERIAIKPLNALKIVYGKSETKRAISNVLMVVLGQYKFTSLPELNAVLKLYNVIADRGREDTKMYKKNGLVYRVLDETGNKVGTPIKASSFYMKPTLAFLQKKYLANESLRAPHKARLQTFITWALSKNPESIDELKKLVEKENISLVLRKGKQGIVYGITYIDHTTKSVFNGSDLGKMYSANGILEKCRQQFGVTGLKGLKNEMQQEVDISESHKRIPAGQKDKGIEIKPGNSNQQGCDYVPFQLKKRKKKKRKRLSM